jgi:hypothetical protein
MPFDPNDAIPAFDRDQIMAILWDDPIATVRGTDLPARLARGEEYLDLQHLETGVQRAARSMTPTGGELSRNAVRPGTWDRLMAHLNAFSQPA